MSDASGERARIRVAVVFGGRSSEHAVSCSTAASVLRALDRDRYDVVPIGIATDGRWVLVADDPTPLELRPGHRPEVSGDGPGVLVPTSTADRSLTVLEPGEVPRSLGDVDVVLPLLHGPFGEDGTLQGLLELADVPYVGSGVLASAAAMDKQFMKVLLAGAGLPVGPHVVVTDAEWQRDPAASAESVAALGWPVFVKPARGGSSMGISKVHRAEDLAAAVESAREHDPKVVVEAAVVGREIECGVLESLTGGPPETAPLGEIEVLGGGHEFYDFDAKYLDEEHLRLTCPADLSDEVAAQIAAYAVRSFQALGCEGLARVDFFLTEAGDIVVNEVNTMPGFTPVSMFPLVWAAAGLDYPALVDRLLQLALRRRTGLR
ncbi:MAG: D-alanine--D-alanine ligase [Actinomycetota bacterium]|nr:D-alanine--D-alanine ligase [Actinomycetota bacterium]